MLWKQVPEFFKHNTSMSQITNTHHTNRKFPQRNDNEKIGGVVRVRKGKKCVPGYASPIQGISR